MLKVTHTFKSSTSLIQRDIVSKLLKAPIKSTTKKVTTTYKLASSKPLSILVDRTGLPHVVNSATDLKVYLNPNVSTSISYRFPSNDSTSRLTTLNFKFPEKGSEKSFSLNVERSTSTTK